MFSVRASWSICWTVWGPFEHSLQRAPDLPNHVMCSRNLVCDSRGLLWLHVRLVDDLRRCVRVLHVGVRRVVMKLYHLRWRVRILHVGVRRVVMVVYLLRRHARILHVGVVVRRAVMMVYFLRRCTAVLHVGIVVDNAGSCACHHLRKLVQMCLHLPCGLQMCFHLLPL